MITPDAIRQIPTSAVDCEEQEITDETQAKINNIAASIEEIGQLHPITVRAKPNGRYELMTGYKRLLALKVLGDRAEPSPLSEPRYQSLIALVIPETTTDEQAWFIHIHENLQRYNLPWYEEVELKKQLHERRQHEKGVGKRGKKVGWSLRDTAEELGISFGNLSEDLRLAEAVLLDPSLKLVKDKQTAKKLLFTSLKRTRQEFEAGTTVGIDYNVVHLGSSAPILQQLPPNIFDACITDPPWLKYKDDTLTRDEETLEVFKELYRVMKVDSFLYMFVGTEDFYFYSTELPKLKWKVQTMPLIWVKEKHLTRGTRSWEYSRDYEPILLAVRGSPALSLTNQLSSIMPFPIVHYTKAIHPNEKPLPLIEKLLGHCTFDGSMVIDPFAGSGVVGEACAKGGRRYVLIERSKPFHDKILERLGSE